ncbi:phytanoyl-CoA dioxygenase family protein [Allobranchiibius sp. GilTou73]|uniref:phytanoyl-CoA dioxygenase family protein n=1 Tax=Allobranchiibius sp. GilTou73 TaxID=2904523 RepID=UPI001F3D279F|nr:phytanoyl-CoA dioxygenase family protein [Allobranchiibius sp. GilTou73]UIJ35418.1 phytanoyl-CoA dioxygenase family protein [Allobranchiibius sp. GilTou73]
MFEQALADLDVAEFWRKGYAILPDVYTDAEVEQMRSEVREHCGSGGGELATSPMRHVLADGRMAAVAKKLLDTDEVLYGGDSSATINGVIRAWHKDNTDRLDPDAPDWDDRYTQLRFGIYLQDHTEHTGGLNLKVGSQDICDLETGPTLYCQNSPNDLLVWSMRMTHSGAGTLLKDPSARFPEPDEWNAFPPEEIAPAHDERMAVFAHLGANDKHGRRYLDYLKTRTYIVDAWRKRPFTPQIIDELAAVGMVVRDMPAEVKDDKRAGLSKLWAPYWYPGKAEPVAAAPEPAPAAAPAAAPAPAPAAPSGTAPSQAFARRYGRAVKRRASGMVSGAKQGWHDAEPKAKKAARAGR